MKKLVSILLLISSISTFSSQPPLPSNKKSKPKFTFEIGTGVINGESRETVYEGNHLLSELTWRLENVPIVEGKASYQFNDDWKVNLGGWTKVGTPKSSMDDYDWMNGSGTHTHWSTSDTELDKGYMIDVNLEYKFYRMKKGSISTLLGFKNNTFKWNAIGGHGIYNGKPVTFKDRTVITYEEKLYVPYLGFIFDYNLSKFNFKTSLTGTPFAFAENTDYHHIRNDGILFEQKFKNIVYLNLGETVGYDITENFTANLSINLQKYFHQMGTETVTVNGVKKENNGAGNEHYSYVTTIGLEYKF